ncbi:MAG: trehalose-phosphatase [Acidobacteriaceae bacterium]
MCHFPLVWATSEEAAGLVGRLRAAPRSLLMLDYDGTLAPFHVDRFQATPYPGVEGRLAALSALRRVRLILVSGRSARELRGLLRRDIEGEIWGSHGREWLGRDGAYQLFALNGAQRAALDRFQGEITALGLKHTLEVKPSSIAVHWRSVDQATGQRIRASVESTFARLGEVDSLRLLPFDGGVELRSIDRTKGTPVAEILGQEPEGVPAAYLGDDFTDEDAFAALDKRGFSVLVRDGIRKSCARFWLRPPEELLGFLDQWIAGAAP